MGRGPDLVRRDKIRDLCWNLAPSALCHLFRLDCDLSYCVQLGLHHISRLVFQYLGQRACLLAIVVKPYFGERKFQSFIPAEI